MSTQINKVQTLFDIGARSSLSTRQSFSCDGKFVVRTIETRDGQNFSSSVPVIGGYEDSEDLGALFDISWLRCREVLNPVSVRGQITVADLFSGCGGLTLGIQEACRALGLEAKPLLAVDTNEIALASYVNNFPTARCLSDPIECLLDGELGSPLTHSEEHLAGEIGSIDLLVGGPPCQGHSDLNNHTRRNDPKNGLFLRMARFVEVFRPKHVIIENVPGAIHDKTRIVWRTSAALESLGYSVDSIVMNAAELGVPQRRKRFFLIASTESKLDISRAISGFKTKERTFRWACDDLENIDDGSTFNTAARHSLENQKRINYLFDHELFDLPDEQRPDCHRLKPHSYKSVYGRLRWDEAARTITRGFGSTGQGRFVHPSRRRSITPHEAARLQFYPDFFRFPDVGRRALQELIGNAVPSKLSYIIGLELLR